MPSPNQVVHDIGKGAVRDISKGQTGRIIEITDTLISVAIYDSLSTTSMMDYTMAVNQMTTGSALVETQGSVAHGGEPVMYQEIQASSERDDKVRVDAPNKPVLGRQKNIWAPPSSPRVVHVRPGFENIYTYNVMIGDWVTLIPIGTGDTYSIGNIISTSDMKSTPVEKGPVQNDKSAADMMKAGEMPN